MEIDKSQMNQRFAFSFANERQILSVFYISKCKIIFNYINITMQYKYYYAKLLNNILKNYILIYLCI